MCDYRDDLEVIIKKKFKNQTQFANEVGISRSYVSKIFSKHRHLSMELFLFILDELGYKLKLETKQET